MSSKGDRRLLHVDLGRLDYRRALEIQRDLHARRVTGVIPDVVLTVEHPSVVTIGRSGSLAHLLVPQDRLDREGIALVHVERGGDITYHGPGQLVVYPILDLRDHGRDIKQHIARLEDAAIGTLDDLGIHAIRRAGYPGVWVEGRKIASIGVYVKNWVTRHGLALNVAVDRGHFAMINPCGLGVEIASIDEWAAEVRMDDVRARFLSRFAAHLGGSVRPMTLDDLVREAR